MTTFTAKYACGTCTDCRALIKPGEEILRNSDNGYAHAECPEPELDHLVGKPVCQTCWVIGPCDCD